MTPVQVIRTVAIALIAGGAALGLVPSGSCGAGWWSPASINASYGWFAYTQEPPPMMMADVCGTAMAPVGSWAIALIVGGVALLVSVWINTSYQVRGEPQAK